MPNIGSVHLEDDHGMAWLLRSNFISPSKVIFDISSIAAVEVSSGAEVQYKNRTIGYVQDVRYNKIDGYLIAFFNLVVGRQYLPETDYLFAVPNLKAHTIQCPICLSVFKPGSDACECILTSPVIQMPKIILDGVMIHHGMHDDIHNLDKRAMLLTQYFGGSVASINLSESDAQDD